MNMSHALNPQTTEAFGREMDAIRNDILATLGEKDARYIRRVIRAQRLLAVSGRALIYGGIALPPLFFVGAGVLGAAKILENMEIGHNVMHGQWDWMRDPKINSRVWEWDTASPSAHWKQSHNHEHHTWTNVVGMDRDVGYGILRMSEMQKWRPYYLFNPVWNALLAIFFQWGVAMHDLEAENIWAGKKDKNVLRRQLRLIGRKAGRQVLKDYLLFPLLAGPFFLPVLLANIGANLIRNLWSYMIIFCGHFPEGVHHFTPEQVKNETRGHWYVRQLLGSCNIEGGKLMHLMSGNLSHQIEHHLFPDLPSSRYAEAAVRVRAACEKLGLPYNSGSLARQFGTTLARVFRLALPDRLPQPLAA